MLYGNVDIPEVPLQQKPLVNCVGPGSMEEDVYGLDRLPHSPGNGQPGLGHFRIDILVACASRRPDSAHTVYYVGPCGGNDGLSLPDKALNLGAVPEHGRRNGGPGLGCQFYESIHCATGDAHTLKPNRLQIRAATGIRNDPTQ